MPQCWGQVGRSSETRPQGEDGAGGGPTRGGGWGKAVVGVGWGPPDLTLPLVEMAEMERPVMEVTVTESRMMIQVRTGGADGDMVTPELSGSMSQARSLSQPTGSPCN